MQTISEKQALILDLLLDFPEGKTLAELASHLEITKTAAKEHVQKLLDRGYLSFMDATGAVGRPKRRYLLTESGLEAFPRQYSWLSNMLLELLSKEMGGVEVSKLMRNLADHVAGPLRERLARREPGPKLYAEITSILNELGYRASLRQSDIRKGVIIEATNCVYHSVAKTHPELCQFDIRLLENLGQGKTRLESCIARGGSVCRFCIKKTPDTDK